MDDSEDEFNTFSEMNEEMPMASSGESAPDTGLRAGINYCKYLSEQMQNEVIAEEEKLDFVRDTSKKLKQNVIDLDIEKQSMIMKFQEKFRKYDTLNTYVNKLDEEIEIIKDFFEKTVGLEADIRHSENEEQRILNILMNTLEEYAVEFRNIENNLVAENEILEKNCDYMNRKIEEYRICDKINSDLEKYIRVCEKKIHDLTPLVNFSETLETLKEKIRIEQTTAETTATEFKQKTNGLALQIKQEIDLLRSQVRLIRERVQNECTKFTAIQREIKSKFENLKHTNDDLSKKLISQETVIEKLNKIKEDKQNALNEWLDKLNTIDEEVISKSNVLNEQKTIIQNMECRKHELLTQNEKIEEDFKRAKAENEKLRKDLDEFKEFNSLMDQYKNLKERKTSLIEKGKNLDKKLEELSGKNDELIEEVKKIKFQIKEENKRINDLKISAEELDTNYIFETSKDSKLLEMQLGIEAEENSLNELCTDEIDSLYEKLHEILSKLADSEIELSQKEKENLDIQNEISERTELLKKLNEEDENHNSSIQEIKQNVYQGIYVTMQELNKKLNAMVNGKNVEMERVAKLKNEIANLEDKLEDRSFEIRKNDEEFIDSVQLSENSDKAKKKPSTKGGDKTRRKKQ